MAERIRAIRAEIAALPQPTLGLAGGVNRAEVLRILDRHLEGLGAIEAQARRDALLALRATVEGLREEAQPDDWYRRGDSEHAEAYADVLSAIDHQLGETP